MDSVDADRAYGIKGNNKRLQIVAVLYIRFYVFRKIACL